MKIIVEEDAFFDCHSCGKCCRADWTISVEKSKVERLAEIGPPLAIVSDTGGPRLNRSEGGCKLLEADGLCGAHRILGAESKPLACQMFPFVVTPIPGGVHLGASYFCPSVRAGKGRPLTAHLEQMRARLQSLHDPACGQDVSILSAKEPLGWNAYQVLEQSLLEQSQLKGHQVALLGLNQGLRETQQWWRQDPELLFQEPSAEALKENQARAEKLARRLGMNLTEARPSLVADRYLNSLIRRKHLRRGEFLEGLLVLAALHLLLQRAESIEEALDRLEMELTHAPGASPLEAV